MSASHALDSGWEPATTADLQWLVGRTVVVTAMGSPDPELRVGDRHVVEFVRMAPRGVVVVLAGQRAALVWSLGDRFRVVPKSANRGGV